MHPDTDGDEEIFKKIHKIYKKGFKLTMQLSSQRISCFLLLIMIEREEQY